MQAYLKKHGSSFSQHRIKVDWQHNLRNIQVNFEVQKRTGVSWQFDDIFTKDWSKNWGLWNKDVVEVFLQLRKDEADINAPYLELQVSPLNQPFALVITEPRKKFFSPAQLDFQSQVVLEDKMWRAQLELVLPQDLLGDSLYGGFFSCLGSEPREFYALNPNSEANPDFHRPELFLKFFNHE